MFGPPVLIPASDGSGRDRTLLRQAAGLLAEAGWTNDGGILRDEQGEAFTVEFLIDQPTFNRVLTPYIANLKAVGIDASIRLVDAAQYSLRVNDFDFDVVMNRVKFQATPLDGLNLFYSSETADVPATFNFAGIKDPVLDALLEEVPKVETRPELVTLLRAMDRVLRARRYAILTWVLASHRVAHWDIFDQPSVKPDYAFTPETTWWFDDDKAVAIGMAG